MLCRMWALSQLWFSSRHCHSIEEMSELSASKSTCARWRIQWMNMILCSISGSASGLWMLGWFLVKTPSLQCQSWRWDDAAECSRGQHNLGWPWQSVFLCGRGTGNCELLCFLLCLHSSMSAWLWTKGQQWEWGFDTQQYQLLLAGAQHHVDILSEGVIYKGVWLQNVKCRISGISCITNQGKLLGGEGKSVGWRFKCTHEYKGIFKN